MNNKINANTPKIFNINISYLSNDTETSKHSCMEKKNRVDVAFNTLLMI